MKNRIVQKFLKAMTREERGMKPVILKCSLALALSFAGFLYCRLRTRTIKPSPTSPKGRLSGHGSEVNLGGGIRAASSSCNIVSGGNILDTEECINKVNGNKKDEFLPPEFNDLVQEVDFGNSHNKDVETPRSKVGSPTAYATPEKDDHEQEIRKLRNMIRILQERERSLEVQLLEYCGLREQETAVMELQNRLKISNMEAKMFTLKVETLQSENRRLQAQVADHAKVLAELETARTKVKMLKKKIRYEAEQNREQIKNLQHRVSKLQDQEWKAAASDRDTQLKLQRLKDFESEVEELRKSNLRLQGENSDLARRLDSTQILANAVLEEQEAANALKEKAERLRQENEGLAKEIEQLQADRCSDVEELVYLRWINACLRHELRNYQPPPGKTVARDLSKSLSPTSEKKAKQLILEYANNDGPGNISDFDSDQWSSYQTSAGEIDDFSSLDNSSAARNNTTSKSKIFGKLMKLVRGKDSHHHRSSRVTSQEDSPHFSVSTSTGNDTGGESMRSEYATPFDYPRTTGLKEEDRRNSDSLVMGSSKKFSKRRGGSGDLRDRLGSFSDSSSVTEKSDLVKYAEALKNSSPDVKSQIIRRRSASYCPF